MDLFKLNNVYEFFLPVDKVTVLCRIEVFKQLEGDLLRARVWLQKMYNLYPAEINTNAQGDDLHHIHSSDFLSQDITYILDDIDMMTGVLITEIALVHRVKEQLVQFYRSE